MTRAALDPPAELSLTPTPPADVIIARASLGGEEVAILSYPITREDVTKQLTTAEREIVRALLSGKSNAEIARERGSAERTVANQVASAYRKLAVRSRAELAARCALVGAQS